jgi:hypothetical protein
VRWRDVGGSHLRHGRGASDGLAWWRHHVGGVDHTCILICSSRSSRSQVLGLVTAARVGVVVDTRVTGEFIRATEALCAARELAGVGFLAGVRPDVSCLMLQAVESTVAKRALVRPGQILADLLGRGTSTLHERRQKAYRGSH